MGYNELVQESNISSPELKRDIEFLFELGTLRHTKRGWHYLVNRNMQNVVEHEHRVLWTTYVLSMFLDEDIDLAKALSIALTRKVYLARTGVPHYISIPNLTVNTNKAIHDCLSGTSFANKTQMLMLEYEKQESTEAQLVHNANLIEDILELNELKNDGLAVASIWLDRIRSNIVPKITLDIAKEFSNRAFNIPSYNWHINVRDGLGINASIDTISDPIDRAVNFLYEIGTMRTLERSWNQFADDSFSNLAEHTFRTAWISYIISQNSKDVNVEKAILMSMLHDVDEIRGADLNYIQTQYVSRNRQKSFTETMDWLPKKDYHLKLYEEYKKRTSIEAKIVKDSDRLDPIVELQEIKAFGVDISKLWEDLNYKRLSKKMYTEYGERLLNQISVSAPYDWHIKSDNRFKHEW